MVPEHPKPRLKWCIHLFAVFVLLAAQCLTFVHATEHLTHEHSILCKLFDVQENHDWVLDCGPADCQPAGFRDDNVQIQTGSFHPLTARCYQVRAPPSIIPNSLTH